MSIPHSSSARRLSRRDHFFAATVVLALTVPGVALAQGGGKVFPADPNLSSDRFGLFIGINRYPLLKNRDLNGCVNDALNYKSIFVDSGRFNVQRYAVLTDEKATRAGITRALFELVDEVRAARGKLGPDKPITVVITYAGHGSRVPRLDAKSHLGPMDSSWVASDSDFEGKENIRGEELFAVHSALRRQGAQVIMISDSCHSGTAFRGGKSRGVEMAPNATGPTDGLYAPLLKETQIPADMVAFNNAPGFIWYAACSDVQSAFETIDEKGNHCGKLSLVMRKVLLNATDTSYSGLARQVAQEFAARWPGYEWQQTPEFHAAVGKENGVFFTNKVAPFHAEVSSVEPGAATISLGELQGISGGAFFRFYANMNDAISRNNEIASGTVERAGAISSTVKIDKAVPLSAWAMPERVRLLDFSVAIDEDASAAALPAWLKAKVDELDKSQQLRVVALKDSPNVVIHCLPNNQIGLYRPTALPGPIVVASSAPAPKPLQLLTAPAKIEDYPELFAKNLLYLARVHRLATLEHACRSALVPAAAADNLPPLTAEIVTKDLSAMEMDPKTGAVPNVQRLRSGDPFTLRISNNTTRPMYATVFIVRDDGTIKMQYPLEGDDTTPIVFGKPLEIAYKAKLDNASVLSERTQMKVIATDAPVPFQSLLIPPETGARNAREIGSRGADDALFNLLRDTLHGGPLTRGDPDRIPIPADWGTLTVVFDAIQPK